MKKKTLIVQLTAAVTASLLAGCGNTAEPVDSGSVVTKEDEADAADEENADADEEETAGTETDDASEETPGAEDEEQEAEAEEEQEESAEPETVNWLEEHEIAITPQGDSTVNLYCYDSYEEDYVGDYEAGLNVTISETTEGVDEGLKKVVAEITFDLSGHPGTGFFWCTRAFDRYTGTYFRVNEKTKEAIRIGDEYGDVRTEMNQTDDYPVYYVTYTVTCPADYDGTVFWIGYWSPEIRELIRKIDFKVRTYTMDELSLYTDGYRCFTLTEISRYIFQDPAKLHEKDLS